MRFSFQNDIHRMPDDAGAGGSGGNPAAGGAATPPAGGAGAPASPDAPAGQARRTDSASPFRPEGLPDHLFGKSDQETIGNLWKATQGFRERMGDVPKEAAGYEFKPSEAVAPFVADIHNNAFFNGTVREAALKAGLGQRQMQGFVNAVIEGMAKDGLLAPASSPEKEAEALAPGERDPRARLAKASTMVREAVAFLDGWKADGLPADVAEQLTGMLDKAPLVKFLHWANQAPQGVRPALAGTTAGITEADLNKRLADPRGIMGTKVYDKAFAEETTRLLQAQS